VQRLIRLAPVVIAVVSGWSVAGNSSMWSATDAGSAEHALFKQTDADVASYDAGYGSAYLARQVGQKKAREIFFLGRTYDAEEAAAMGMVNAVVPHAELEEVALQWGQEICAKSPMSQRMLKFAFNLIDDGLSASRSLPERRRDSVTRPRRPAKGGTPSSENETPTSATFLCISELMADFQTWKAAARPHTLPAAIVPVMVGSGLAYGDGVFRWDAFLAALVGALAIQVAANFANDVSDARRGADTPERLGPPRMVALGVIEPRAMWAATWSPSASPRSQASSSPSSPVRWCCDRGVSSWRCSAMSAGRPPRLPRLGEMFAFIFFGLVATVGSRRP
jgi:hypothetical protein